MRISILFFLIALGLLQQVRAGNLVPEPAASAFGKRGGIFKYHLSRNGVHWPVREGSLWLSGGTNRFLFLYPKVNSSDGFPVQISADYSFDDHFTIGAYGGYYGNKYIFLYGMEPYNNYLKSYVGGLRLGFHFTDFFNDMIYGRINMSKWDIYSTIHIGIVRYQWEETAWNKDQQDFTAHTFASIGLVAGIRYIITPSFSLYAEGGKGVFGYMGFGAAVKIR